MVLVISHDCPYCQTKRISFSAAFEYKFTKDSTRKMVLGICGNCLHGVLFHLFLTRQNADAKLLGLNGGLAENQIQVWDFWPKPAEKKLPENIPDNIASVINQAQICIANEAFDAAGVMFRKALEISTKEKAPEKERATLDKRIDHLADTGLLPKEVRDWAHEIRLEGNFAAHAVDPITKEQALTLEKFCEAFLLYMYSMPELVAESRARRNTPLPVSQ